MENRKSTAPGSAAITIAALGVVFGDIGTSPLYALKECFHGPHAIAINPVNVAGVLSLIFWSLMVVITIKYICFVTKADNNGEGGTFALLAILSNSIKKHSGSKFFKAIPYLALCSAALLYSDGIITPAISVLSAVEGIKEVAPAAENMVIPITCIILAGLFFCQKYGTARIGRVFGPIMLVWFIVIATIGIINILERPEVLLYVSPHHAWVYFQSNHIHGIIVLGSVVLCITGGEALYADLGHFSRIPIKNSWFWVVCPALLLNYMGQGALILNNPNTAHNPFYQSVPPVFMLPVLILATIATVIASQALITGVYSLTQQAMNLGFLPRMRVIHTSSSTKGQVYLPTVNTLLMLACIALVLIFKNSSGLAAAYGLAVTGAMGLTSILYFFVTFYAWNWPLRKTLPLLILFLIFDLPFLGANLLKIIDGGWLPMLASAFLVTIMTTWKKGRNYIGECFARMSMPTDAFMTSLKELKINRSPGIGIYMTINQNLTPMPLARTVSLMHTMPETVVLMTIRTAHTPYVKPDKRIKIISSEKKLGIHRVSVSYGYMETPDMAEISELSKKTDVHLPLYDCTFYLGRETLLRSFEGSSMQPWRRELFVFLHKTSWNVSTFFNIPASRVVEVGTHLEI